MRRERELDPSEGCRRDFDDLLRDFGRQALLCRSAIGDAPDLAALDVAETKDAVEISAELPGVAENEVTVSVEGQSLVISGEKKSESEKKEKSWHIVERSYGSFRRVVPLTFVPDADMMRAIFDKGVLHVSVGKPAEMVAEKVAIPIQKAQ